MANLKQKSIGFVSSFVGLGKQLQETFLIIIQKIPLMLREVRIVILIYNLFKLIIILEK